jgi:hypothetical protein
MRCSRTRSCSWWRCGPGTSWSVARGETGLRARLKTAVFVSYPVVVAAVIFLIVLRSLGYAVAVKYFLRQFLETAAWVVGSRSWLLRRVRALVFRRRDAR